ncbi:hypothetical protein FV242_08285 [Methylobacterium sp. WL64]|nr:hypothetical protein FV242_08285 [Methylobacterium sp. WL64]
MRHPAWPTSIGASRRDPNRDALQRIADTLKCPVETLLKSAHSEVYPDETAELVRLWFKIQDATARRTILEQLRAAAGEPSR